MSQIQYSLSELTDKFFPIYFYRKHLDIACRDLLGLDLSPHHSITLRDWGRNKPTNYVLASRGMGKSVLLAIYILLVCMLYPKLKVVIAAGTGYRGAKMVLTECERITNCFLNGQRDVKFAKYSLINPSKCIMKDPAYWKIEFTNGSLIQGIPLGVSSEGSIVRGLRGHVLGIDEAFLVPDTLFQKALSPMQNVIYEPNKPKSKQTFKNSLMKVSTIDFSHRDFYKEINYYTAILENKDVENKSSRIISENISVFNWDMDNSYYVENNERIQTWGLDVESLLMKKDIPTTDIDIWLSENKNIPLNIAGGYFDFNEIDKGMNLILNEELNIYPCVLDTCNAPCILSIDSAPSGDNTAFVVTKVGSLDNSYNSNLCMTADMGSPCPLLGKGNKCGLKKLNAVINAYQENKMELQDRIKKIYYYMEKFNIIAVAMDSRGGGFELSDLLRDKEYLERMVSPAAKPIYDPDLHPNTDGLPILKLYSTTQDINLQFNSYLKALLHSQTLLCPRPLRERPDNITLLEAAGHCETLVYQLARIKAIPVGQSVKFIIETMDPETGRIISGKKDLYSGLLYGIGRLKELIEENQNKEDIEYPTTLPQAFIL